MLYEFLKRNSTACFHKLQSLPTPMMFFKHEWNLLVQSYVLFDDNTFCILILFT